ncbi:MAG: tRNA 2-thiocytidine(32) synthetase TtcA, partial [Clostridium sp.]
LEEAGVTLIRPMVYIEEREARGFAKKFNLPIIENPCPANGHTKREEVKLLIDSLKKDIPSIKKNLFGSLTNTEQLSIWDKDKINSID